MERLCIMCNQIKNTPYKDKCRNCYQLSWVKNITPKICVECFGTFKTAGKICCVCMDKKRKIAERKLSCSGCCRNGLLIMNKKLNLCNTCNRHKREKEDPEYKQKRTDDQRNFARKYRGTPLDAPIRKSKGFWKCKQGYVLLCKPDHPNAKANGSIFQHTFLMSQHLGRPLSTHESIHHKNGIRDDNRIENLELWSKSHPPGQRVKDKISWAKSFLEEYGYEIIDKNDKQ